MLSRRMGNILRIIVGEYITTGAPVGSDSIVRKHGLRVSSATVRNDMARLEDDGYISHPHTSAGRVPSDKGYRYYLEQLMESEEMPPDEKRTILHQFHQVEGELEEWSRLAAAVLSRIVKNMVVITIPKAPVARFKRLELVSMRGVTVLVVLLLQDAKVKRQIVALPESLDQEALQLIAQRLNRLYDGLSAALINTVTAELSIFEREITAAVVKAMQSEDDMSSGELWVDGVRNLLGQREFSSSERVIQIIDAVHDRTFVESFYLYLPMGEVVTVIVGEENPMDLLRECSLVMARYGPPESLSGAVGVLGPTRMHYAKTIASVQYLSAVMSELIAGHSF
ncbi:MAG: HrcA family transcriptional regulator [Dehalococcoidia bacterium]|nr:HrcA family transcriptional regulator [Dehalococcoidia bacterium]